MWKQFVPLGDDIPQGPCAQMSKVYMGFLWPPGSRVMGSVNWMPGEWAAKMCQHQGNWVLEIEVRRGSFPLAGVQ